MDVQDHGEAGPEYESTQEGGFRPRSVPTVTSRSIRRSVKGGRSGPAVATGDDGSTVQESQTAPVDVGYYEPSSNSRFVVSFHSGGDGNSSGAVSVQRRPLPKPPIPLQNNKELTATNANSEDSAYLQFDRPTATTVGGGETVRPPSEDTNEPKFSPNIIVGGVTSRALEAGKDIANIGVEHSVQSPSTRASVVAASKDESDHEEEEIYENMDRDPSDHSTVSSDLPSNNSSEYDYPSQDSLRRIQVHEDVSVRVSDSWDPRLPMGARNLVLAIDNDTDGRLDYRQLRYFSEDLLSASGINPAAAETVLGCRCQFTGKTSKEKGDAVEELLKTCYQSGRMSWSPIKFNAHMKTLLTSWKGLQVLQEALELQ